MPEQKVISVDNCGTGLVQRPILLCYEKRATVAQKGCEQRNFLVVFDDSVQHRLTKISRKRIWM